MKVSVYETTYCLRHLCRAEKWQFPVVEALKNTSLAGNPEVYFLNGEGWEDGWWAHQNGVTSRPDYLRLVLEKGTTLNGVFGTKIMWNYFSIMLKSLQELPKYKEMEAPQLMATLFPNVHYIWITRRDKVRQAVSWAKAGQTDVYAWSQGETPAPKREPSFDFEFIDQLYNLVLEGEAGWSKAKDRMIIHAVVVFVGYLAKAAEIAPLHESLGFETLVVAGIEPVISSYDESYNKLQGKQRQLWLDTLYELSTERSIIGASMHLIYIGKKQK